ncbi:MAG: hypothetical protein AAF937_06290 [Planctomycetota bacterium]
MDRQTDRSRRIVTIAAAGALLLALPGCYKRVVDSRGLGGDSQKLREQKEREPVLRDLLTTTTEREKRSTSGVR